MTWQDDVFVDRLVRLDHSHAQRARRAQRLMQPSRWSVSLGSVASLLGAGMIGALSVPLLRFAMFHSQGMPNEPVRPGLVLMVDAIFAFCIAFFLVRVLLSVTSRGYMIAQMIGIWVALTTMHNAVHAYPAPWAKAFSPAWVERTVQITEPGTFYLVGLNFP